MRAGEGVDRRLCFHLRRRLLSMLQDLSRDTLLPLATVAIAQKLTLLP